MRCNTATEVLKALEETVTSLLIKKCLIGFYLGADVRVYLQNWVFSLEKDWVKERSSDYTRWVSHYVILVQCSVCHSKPMKVILSCSAMSARQKILIVMIINADTASILLGISKTKIVHIVKEILWPSSESRSSDHKRWQK